MTEEQAVKTWCPMSRVPHAHAAPASVAKDDQPQVGDRINRPATTTRKVESMETNCLGSRCACWRWATKDGRGIPEIFSADVKTLEMTARTTKALRLDGICIIGELVQRTDTELLRIPNLGRKALNEIKARLDGYGIALGMPEEAVQPNLKPRTGFCGLAGKPAFI